MLITLLHAELYIYIYIYILYNNIYIAKIVLISLCLFTDEITSVCVMHLHLQLIKIHILCDGWSIDDLFVLNVGQSFNNLTVINEKN